MRALGRDETWRIALWQPFSSLAVGAHIPAIASLSSFLYTCKHFIVGAHVKTNTSHAGGKKAHDWALEQLADLFRSGEGQHFQHHRWPRTNFTARGGIH